MDDSQWKCAHGASVYSGCVMCDNERRGRVTAIIRAQERAKVIAEVEAMLTERRRRAHDAACVDNLSPLLRERELARMDELDQVTAAVKALEKGGG